MSNKNSAFQNWTDWATTDWKEFYDFFTKEYSITAFQKAEIEFAKQMSIKHQSLTQLTNVAIGKGIEKGVSALAGNVLTISDFMSQIAGICYTAGTRSLDYLRTNPHTLVGFYVWSDGWKFKEKALPDYVKHILYCYPKDLDDGYGGFRYGAHQTGGSKNVIGKLRLLKSKR